MRVTHHAILLIELKGLVHPKMEILSFTHPHVVPNLYDFLSSAEHRRYFEECCLSNW